MDRECFDIACVAGACKTWVQERTGRDAYLPRRDKTSILILFVTATKCMYKLAQTRRDPGGTPLYWSHIRMCRPKGYGFCQELRLLFLRRFGLETGIDCAHFGLESGMVFEGIKGVYQRLYCFNFKCVRKKEKYANLRNLFSCCQSVKVMMA